MKRYILVLTNRYRGISVQVSRTAYPTAKDAMKAIDSNHRCVPLCDYCKAGWIKSGPDWIRDVDHDGADVEYKVHTLSDWKV